MHGDESPNPGDRLPRYSEVDPMPPTRVMPEIERAEETQSLLLEENITAEYPKPQYKSRADLSDLEPFPETKHGNIMKADGGPGRVHGSTHDPSSTDDGHGSFASSRSSVMLFLQIAILIYIFRTVDRVRSHGCHRPVRIDILRHIGYLFLFPR